MLDTLLAVVGILVSLVLFFIGYRQTVGARKERIFACNAEIEKILLRRIVLESYSAAGLDVERLIAGKARDFRIRPDDLLTPAQTLNSVYTRIMESDLLPAEQRRQILERIVPALTEAEAKPAEESAIDASRARHSFLATAAAIGIMAVLASLAGALVAALPGVASLDKTYPDLARSFVATAAASLAVIGFWLALHRIRASQENPSHRAKEVERYVKFEGAVATVLQRLGFAVAPVPPGRAGDFIAERGRRKIVVEAKSWAQRVPAHALDELAARLRQTAGESGAGEVVIVTALPVIDAGDATRVSGVEMLTIRELESYLARTDPEAPGSA